MIEGYDIHVGGGTGLDQKIGRLIKPKVAAEDELPPIVLALLTDWMAHRERGRDLPDLHGPLQRRGSAGRVRARFGGGLT